MKLCFVSEVYAIIELGCRLAPQVIRVCVCVCVWGGV